MIESPHPRPRRRRPPTRGLLFGAPLDRLPADGPTRTTGAAASPGMRVPIALIGERTPIAPPRVTAFGAMAASWPLVDRTTVAPWGSAPTSVERPDRQEPPVGAGALRSGCLSRSEWDRMLGR